MQATKPNIFELDLHHGNVRSLLPVFGALFESTAITDALNDGDEDLMLLPGCSHCTIKLQLNKGSGGCFPLHYGEPLPPPRAFRGLCIPSFTAVVLCEGALARRQGMAHTPRFVAVGYSVDCTA